MKFFYFLLLTMLMASTGWTKTTTWIGGAFNTNWDNPLNWDNGVPAADDIVIFPANTTATIARVAQGGNLSLFSLAVLGNSNIRLTGAISRTITVSNGMPANDFIIEREAQLTIGSNLNITLAAGTNANNPTGAGIDGILIIEDNRTFHTGNPNVRSNVDGVIQNSGTVNAVAANLTFFGGSEYIHTRNGGSVPNATWNGTSTVSIEGITDDGVSNLDQTFGNFTWNNAAQNDDHSLAASGMSVLGTLSILHTGTGLLEMDQANLSVGNFNISGGTFKMAKPAIFGFPVGPDRTLTVAGNVSVTGGTLLMGEAIFPGDAGTLVVHGNFLQTGGTITETGFSSRGSIEFAGTAVQLFSKSGGAIANNIDFSIENNAKVDFGISILNGSTGNFTLSSGGKIITANVNGLRSAGALGSIQVSGTRTYSNEADYEFQGASTGNFSTTSNQVRDLIINNTSGQVTASRVFMVNRTLTLVNGYLTTNATTAGVTVNTAGNATTANGAFINGPLSKATNTLNAFTFPVGKVDGGLRIIGVTPTAVTASTFTAQFFRTAAPAGTLAPGLTRVSSCEYWDLARNAGTAPATVTLSWASGSACSSGGYVSSLAALRVAHLTGGSTWSDEGNSAVTGNATAGTVTSNTVNSFSPFALASSSAANPLPVVFGDVKAYEKNNGVQIEWSNLTEKDVAKYTIERSAKGSDFSAIGQQLPTSNRDDRADYDAFDATPLQGTSFYRIKAEETTGKIVYSKILSVNLGSAGQSLRLYPNPVSGNQVNISLSDVRRGQYNLRVVNTAGQDIVKQLINIQGRTLTQTIDLPTSIKPGVYNVIITNGDYHATKAFIVR